MLYPWETIRFSKYSVYTMPSVTSLYYHSCRPSRQIRKCLDKSVTHVTDEYCQGWHGQERPNDEERLAGIVGWAGPPLVI